MKSNENGRSMIEMLGVIAIVGILSVGGIAGYSKAMAKAKTDRLISEVSELVMGIRSIFLSQKTFKDISSSLVLKAGIVPGNMANYEESRIIHTYGGQIDIYTSLDASNSSRAFEIYINGLEKYTCIKMVTMDWGQDPSSGFQGLYVGTEEVTSPKLENVHTPSDSQPEYGIYTPGLHDDAVPLTPTNAAAACSCGRDGCNIGLKYI